MTKQLRLITQDEQGWRLDEQTRELGLAGVAAARAVLAASRPYAEDGLEENAA